MIENHYVYSLFEKRLQVSYNYLLIKNNYLYFCIKA